MTKRARPARSGSTTRRGYGTEHQAERRRWTPLVNAGQIRCARCGQPIIPGTPWDLGHNDTRTTWTGPEHARCNRAAGARKGNRKRRIIFRSRW